ncbi:MAG: hypothetical protein AUI36_26715 [Cyanobacteria bacterium 13_1_40CM_2_61_4]|nr:MAG: hypothetical protein AUI36_26715 [Cyanobacteria bacterium 13_1_40CM_2_61_4]
MKVVEGLKDFLVQNPVGKIFYPRIMYVNKLGKKLLGVDLIRSIRDSDPYQNGGWHGNDTVWRMVLDLNKILLYGRSDGTLGPRAARRMVTVVDGLYAGEGEGPLKPSLKTAGVFMVGVNSLALDIVAATLMGFDYGKIKLLSRALEIQDFPLRDHTPPEAVQLRSNVAEWHSLDGVRRAHLGFRPPRGWVGHIELDASAADATSTAA